MKRIQHRTLAAPPEVVKRARALRKHMSLPEVLLWQQLRKRPGGYKFRKQYPHPVGALDFTCLSARLNIEVDGEAHDRDDQPAYDAGRDLRLQNAGFRIVRIPASEVLGNMEGVLLHIVSLCEGT